MNKENLLISIITPTFNRGRYLEECILSIKNQDYKNIEHIIIDGGSTDNSLEIIKKYEKTYNLKWISEKDNGCADAMEKGFQMATGYIFCWLDSDDFYLPNTIEKIIKVFTKNPKIDVVFGDMLICDLNSKIIDYTKKTTFDREALIYSQMVVNPQTTFWKSDLHKKIGGINRKYLRCGDYDFFCKMAISNAKFYHIRDFLAVYRSHSEQLTKSLDICNAETKEINQKYYDKNISDFGIKIKKTKIWIKRVFYFLIQGDIWYVVRSILIKIGFIHI